MKQTADRSLGSLFKKPIVVSVIVLGLIFGTLGISIIADMPVVPGQFILDWPRVATFALFTFISLIASIAALRKPRLAGLLCLFAALVQGACFIWWMTRGRVHIDVSFRELFWAFIGASLPFIVLGVFWLATYRAGWPTIMAPRPSKKLSSILVAVFIFAFCMLGGLLLAFYFRVNGWGDCSPNPPITAPQYPDQAVFTAKVLMVSHGFAPLRYVLSSWSLLRVEHQFWGVPSWAGFVILLPKKYADEYFIDARRSQGLLMHFLPVLEFRMCSRTQALQHAAVDLRLLQEGSRASEVRIMGQVFDGEYMINKPVQGVRLWITGPNGKITTTTDAQGMYDLTGLPDGHYSIHVDPAFLHHLYPDPREADLKAGQIWNPIVITDFHGAYAP